MDVDPRLGEIVADVRGGPIWLSTLGVHDGDMGLFDVGKTSLVSRAHVVLSADGQVLRVDGEGKLEGLSLRNDALSEEPVAGLDLAWRAKAALRLDGTRIEDERSAGGAAREPELLLAGRPMLEVGTARRFDAWKKRAAQWARTGFDGDSHGSRGPARNASAGWRRASGKCPRPLPTNVASGPKNDTISAKRVESVR
jgi:hypothetical protein